MPFSKPDGLQRRAFRRGFARALRANPTEAEKILWLRLRRKALGGLRFRRQQPFGPYIADFFCAAARLIVELDGDQHGAAGALAYDAARTRFLCECGYRVLRFSNGEVLRNPDLVADAILAAVEPLPEIRSADFDPPSRGG